MATKTKHKLQQNPNNENEKQMELLLNKRKHNPRQRTNKTTKRTRRIRHTTRTTTPNSAKPRKNVQSPTISLHAKLGRTTQQTYARKGKMKEKLIARKRK